MILFRDRAVTILYEVLTTMDKHAKFLLPLNICPIVPDTFVKAGIQFEFVDVNPITLCMDEELALKMIKNDSAIGGLLLVRTFGIEINPKSFYQGVKELNPEIFIIDDQCLSMQNFDLDIDKTSASLTLFSSGYSKYVDIGYGGFGFLKDDKFKGIFQDNSNDSDFLSYKRIITKKIPLIKEHKSKINAIYRKEIPTDLHLGSAFENWRFSILVDDKERLLQKIFQHKGLFASSHYEPIDYKYTKHPMQNSNARKISDKIVNLFNDFRFTEEKAAQCAQIVSNFAR